MRECTQLCRILMASVHRRVRLAVYEYAVYSFDRMLKRPQKKCHLYLYIFSDGD